MQLIWLSVRIPSCHDLQCIQWEEHLCAASFQTACHQIFLSEEENCWFLLFLQFCLKLRFVDSAVYWRFYIIQNLDNCRGNCKYPGPSCCKATVHPQFLYLFQHIPVFIRKSFFSNLDQLISSFLWGNKWARIGRIALRLPKSLGRLALPDFHYYYWACNINKLLFWNTGKAVSECPQWALLEISSSRFCLWSVVCSQLPC